MIQFIFFDLDDTILDFKKAEKCSITETLREFGLDSSESTVQRYSEINASLWKRLEHGELKRAQLLSERFRILLRELGGTAAVQDMRDAYEGRLARSYFLKDEALSVLDALYPRARLFIASNGISRVQRSRIKGAFLDGYFEELFISEELGAEKPSPLFFERAFAKIPHFRRECALIVGDSLSSDIAGGIAAGIKTCLFNPERKANNTEVKPKFEIRRLSELTKLIDNI